MAAEEAKGELREMTPLSALLGAVLTDWHTIYSREMTRLGNFYHSTVQASASRREDAILVCPQESSLSMRNPSVTPFGGLQDA